MAVNMSGSKSTKEQLIYTADTAFASLNQFRKDKKFCDVKIQIDKTVHPAHKIVLSAFSPFFEAMFSGQYAEAIQPTVSLQSVESSVMDTILEYAYNGNVEITAENVEAIFHGANYLQTLPLFNNCCEFMGAHLTAANCLAVWKLAEVYSCTVDTSIPATLKSKAKDYTLKNFSKVCEEREFLEIETEILEEIVSDDSLNVDSEEIVFDAVIKWLHYKEEQRAGNFEKVLQHVRLARLNIQFLNDRVAELKCLSKSEQCMRLFQSANDFYWQPHRRMELQSSISRWRQNSTFAEAMEIRSYSNSSYCLTDDGLRLPERNKRVSHVLSYGTLVPSNYNALLLSDDYQSIYIPVQNVGCIKSYQAISPLDVSGKNSRNKIVFSELDGSWYAIGGQYPDKSASDIVMRFDCATNGWQKVAPLLEAVFSPAVVSLQGYLYVIGGSSKEGTQTTKIQRFLPRTNLWTEYTSLPAYMCVNPSACALDKHIYVFGYMEKRVCVLDVSTAEQSHCAEMKYCWVSGPVIVNGNIFVVSKKSDEESAIERFSPSTNLWTIFREDKGVGRPLRLLGPFIVRRDEEA